MISLSLSSQIQLITSKGYPAESHWVTTPDGYILGLHRIPGPRPNTSTYTAVINA